MWSVYLELHRGSSLHPQPWAHEAVPVAEDVDVADVASAADWAGLVSRHPRRWQNLTYPDWPALAREHAGVHLSAAAIAAAQDFNLRLPDGGATAPLYWDVESTVWLRWPLAPG
jgi:hypothetical protein